ncbi:hypothetical protein LguiA_020175 [Lonicera macranthoides]
MATRTAEGKRAVEWDPTHWKWDGDLFLATPLNSNSPNNIYQSRQRQQLFPPLQTGGIIPMPRFSSNSSSSCSDEVNLGIQRATSKTELEKRRRVTLIEDDDEEAGSLSLKPAGAGGGEGHMRTTESEVVNWEVASGGKRPKLMMGAAAAAMANSNRVVCRVENCGADLSKAKTYHRRHKVCEMHSKASKALVGNVLQRFCQQCSRFHALQEFDEGKRSCRRRLAGHNRRRRKTEPDAVVNSSSANDNQATGYLLISLLKILSDIHSNRTDHTEDQDLLAHLLRNLAGEGNLHEDINIAGLLQESLNNCPPIGNSDIVSALLSNGPHHGLQRLKRQHCTIPASSEMPQKGLHDVDHHHARVEEIENPQCQTPPGFPFNVQGSPPTCTERARDSSAGRTKLNNFDLNDTYIDSVDSTEDPPVPATVSLDCQQDSLQSSPPQASGNSDSASSQSPSSSSGDTQLCSDLSSSLNRLIDVSDDVTFWRTGWVYVRVQNQIAFMYNGEVVADTYLPFNSSNCSTILSVKPIAVSVSEKAQFLVKGYNILRPSTRLLCGLEGNYLVQDPNHYELVESVDTLKEDDGLQCLNFSCSIPAATGRGFIEVENHAVNSSFFPFIVAEKDFCMEIRMLEREIDDLTETYDVHGGTGKTEARSRAMEFLHEMGWLLHRSHLKSRLGHPDPNSELFSFKRYRWLMEFSMDHDWCAVVRKLLDILLDGTVGAAGENHPFLKPALFEMGLLHRAVRRSSRPMVELLLGYVPDKVADELRLEYESLLVGGDDSFLFRPDVVGPAGLTPLHVAAGIDGSENVLDAFTNGKVGIEAWRNARDSTGSTPEDCARLRGCYSYIHLVQRKINKKIVTGDVVVEIPTAISVCNDAKEKKNEEGVASFQTEIRSIIKRPCKLCDRKLVYGNGSNRSLLYRPAMLSMVAVAAVCVCVALLLKSSPEVLYVLRPFRWERLEVGYS